MKTLALIFSLMLSTNAFSKQNYFHETCTFESSKGEINLYKTHYWDGHHMLITSDYPGLDEYEEVWLPGKEGSDDDHVHGTEVIVFRDVSDGVIMKQSYDDGCWQGFIKSFTRRARVAQSNLKIQEILNLNSGDELSMKCSYEHLEMLGDGCDKL